MNTVPVFKKGGVAKFKLAFTDETGKTMRPSELYWTVYRMGQVVNDRDRVQVSLDDYYQEDGIYKLNIVLQGADLVGGTQYLIFDGEYNSDLGSDLPLPEWFEFYVETGPQSTDWQ